MSNSLFDQLKQAGLVNKNKANKIKHDQYKNKKNTSKKELAKQRNESAKLDKKKQADKAERDRLMNQQKNEDAERKAIAAQIIQLIETNAIDDAEGEIVYNFTDAGLVKRLYVSEQSHKLLMSGRIAVAKHGEAYKLVPKMVAEKIMQRDAECIINADHSIEEDSSENDPYADYKIPDDLMW